jgi:hypothetical protein
MCETSSFAMLRCLFDTKWNNAAHIKRNNFHSETLFLEFSFAPFLLLLYYSISIFASKCDDVTGQTASGYRQN